MQTKMYCWPEQSGALSLLQNGLCLLHSFHAEMLKRTLTYKTVRKERVSTKDEYICVQEF